MHKSIDQPFVVIPNLNGGDELFDAIESLRAQTVQPHIIIVDNASTDGSVERLKKLRPRIELIEHSVNLGYAGGVNPGLRRAIELGATYVAPFNDDAIADKCWLAELVGYLDTHPKHGAAACKVLTSDGQRIDSTGEFYTLWGLPYPRGRREYDHHQYDTQTTVFAASGAASLYRVASLEQVGLLDEDFFAYYEDVDLSFRLQLAGWKVGYVPGSVVYHRIGMTSGRVKGFTTRMTLKNLPLLWIKNVPRRYLWRTGWRLALAQTLFFGRAVSRGQFGSALKGSLQGWYLLVRKLPERRRIQHSRIVSDDYIWGLVVQDLPPNAHALHRLKGAWQKLRNTRG